MKTHKLIVLVIVAVLCQASKAQLRGNAGFGVLADVTTSRPQGDWELDTEYYLGGYVGCEYNFPIGKNFGIAPGLRYNYHTKNVYNISVAGNYYECGKYHAHFLSVPVLGSWNFRIGRAGVRGVVLF